MKSFELMTLIVCSLVLFPILSNAESKALVPITSLDKANPIIDPSILLSNKVEVFPSVLDKLSAPIAENASSASTSLVCPSNKAGLTDGYQIFTYSLTSDMAASLSYWSKAELSASDKVILYQFTWYKDILAPDGAINARCGAGVLLVLKVSNIQGGVTINLPTLAASAQLGQSSIIYKLGTFGLSGSAIDATIPTASTIGKFDTESYAALMQSINQIQAGYKSGPSNFVVNPRPIAVSFSVPTPGTDTVIATQAFALNQIALGKKCKEAKNSLPVKENENERTVENVYSTIAGKGCGTFDGPPSADVQKNAKDLLIKYKFAFN